MTKSKNPVETVAEFPVFNQHRYNDCGIACLKMLATYYEASLENYDFNRLLSLKYNGVTLYDLQLAAQKLGFDAYGVKVTFEELVGYELLPCIMHWQKSHFVVIPPQKIGLAIKMIDPARGAVMVARRLLIKKWYMSNDDRKGYAFIIKKKE